MFIEYLGHSSFLISGEEYSVITDPFSGIGYTVKRVRADYCIVSHDHFDHNYVFGVDVGRVIKTSTERFRAVECFHDNDGGKQRGTNRIFCFTLDGVNFCHTGDIGEDFNSEIVKQIGEVDILFIPIGGNYTIDAKEAKKYIDAINPKVVIPMHYKTPLSNLDISGLGEFYKLFEDAKVGCEKVVFTKDDLPKKTEACVLGELKRPDFTDEQLNKTTIHDLRVILREIGSAPGAGNKTELIETIKSIRNYKTISRRDAKGRHPLGNFNISGGDIRLVMPPKSGERLAEPETYQLEKEEFIVERTLKGRFKCVDAEDYSDLDINIPEDVVNLWGLKSGDKVTGRAEKNRFSGISEIKTIYSVEGFSNGKRTTPDFEKCKSSYPDERVVLSGRTSALVNLFTPIGKGQKTLVKLPEAKDENYVVEQFVKAFGQLGIKSIYLALNARQEDVDTISEYPSTEVAFTGIKGENGEALRLCALVPERAKRIVESGKDCLIVVNGIDRLLENGDMGDDAVKGLLLAAKKVKDGNSLTVVIISKSEKIKEYRSFSNSYIEIGENGFNFLESYTRKAEMLLSDEQFSLVDNVKTAIAEGSDDLVRFLKTHASDEEGLISGIAERFSSAR